MSPIAASKENQLAAIRAAWGLLLAASAARRGADSTQTLPERRIIRLLGARQLLQATAVLAGSRKVARAWWVDGLHSASMLALSAAVPAVHRLARIDATVAAAFAIATRATTRGQIPARRSAARRAGWRRTLGLLLEDEPVVVEQLPFEADLVRADA